MLATTLTPVDDQIGQLRAKMVAADRDQARAINRQILHRLATRIHYLEAELALIYGGGNPRPVIQTPAAPHRDQREERGRPA